MEGAALVGRAAMSAIFLWSGYAKLMAPTATIATFAGMHLPLPQVAYFAAVVMELLGGAALLLGVRARWAAAALAAWCVLTAITVHYHPGDRGQMIHFMKNICMAGGLLQVFAFGAGRLAVTRD